MARKQLNVLALLAGLSIACFLVDARDYIKKINKFLFTLSKKFDIKSG